MSCKVIFGLFIYGIYFCSANPLQIGDDKSNWEAVWKGMKGVSAISRSGNTNIFDRIVRINAEERGSGRRRSDDRVFLFQGDIQVNGDDVVNMVQNDEKSRQTRAAIINNGRNLWPRNVPYAISGSLCCQGNVRPDWLCDIWRCRGYCQGRYATYMKRNCCEACGTAVSSCTDRNTSGNCTTWARYGFCSRSSRFYSYMTRNCAKSCGCI